MAGDMFIKTESVVFIKGNQKYSGHVLGCEKDYFWLLVPDLENVYVGHPDRVFEQGGTKYFEIFDHCRPINKIFNSESGEIDSSIFEYSNNPESIIGTLRAYKLINAI